MIDDEIYCILTIITIIQKSSYLIFTEEYNSVFPKQKIFSLLSKNLQVLNIKLDE